MPGEDVQTRTATLALTGDVMLGRLVDQAIARHGPAYPWGDVVPTLAAANLRIVNLECVIASGGKPWSRWEKVFHFRAGPAAISTLKLAGIDCVVLANNHVLDYEEAAFLEMLDLLEQHGIAYAGAGRNLEEAMLPAMLSAHGVRVGVVAFTDNEPGWAATADKPGTNYIPISLEERSLGPVREAIGRARSAGADFVVFSIHWGPNMVQRPRPHFRRFARAVIEAGADVFHGHSAHVFQGIEVYGGRPILYDAGDFVDDYAVDRYLRNDWGMLFGLHLAVPGSGFRVPSQTGNPAPVRQLELVPVRIGHCQVKLAGRGDFAAIAGRMRALSSEMGTMVHDEGGRLWVE